MNNNFTSASTQTTNDNINLVAETARTSRSNIPAAIPAGSWNSFESGPTFLSEESYIQAIPNPQYNLSKSQREFARDRAKFFAGVARSLKTMWERVEHRSKEHIGTTIAWTDSDKAMRISDGYSSDSNYVLFMEKRDLPQALYGIGWAQYFITYTMVGMPTSVLEVERIVREHEQSHQFALEFMQAAMNSAWDEYLEILE